MTDEGKHLWEENSAPQAAPAEAPEGGIGGEPVKNSGWMLFFGALVLIFAIIGVISTITFFSNLVTSHKGEDKVAAELEWLITPVVMQDPPAFSSPDGLTDATIITAGVWRLIMNEDTSRYPIDQMNFITVPASDIEVQIKSLFGNVSYTHQSVESTALMITYDKENKSYIFPAVPHVLAYTPQIQEMSFEDGVYTLTVGYIPPGLVWKGDTLGNTYRPAAEKVMIYTVRTDDKGECKLYAADWPEASSLPSE